MSNLENDKGEITRRLQVASAVQSHLSNVISGLNHEISPWLGSINNTLQLLSDEIEVSCRCEKERKNILKKIKRLEKAAQQATIVLSMTSINIKKLQNYANNKSNLYSTIDSWVKITVLDTEVKRKINENNLLIDKESLNFDCTHSPMLLSQVILNLAKNSIEHNNDILDEIKIKIYGNPDRKFLIFEDNGKGIPSEILQDLFSPGTTTKETCEDGHGLGLSACLDYCISMGALIWAQSKQGEFTRFIIAFDRTNNNVTNYYKKQDSEYGIPDKNILKKRYSDSGRFFTKR